MTQISAEMRKYRACMYQAAARGIPFLLMFDEWWNIWQQSGHWHERGNLDGDKYCMARNGDVGPYAIGNVTIITNRENSIEGGSHSKPRQPRPPITLDNGDVLIPKDEAATELGISRRTLTRMRVPTTTVGGVSYVSQRGLRKQIEDGIATPKKRRAR